LKQVIAVTGQPCAYLKDGGADLAKAVRLLNEEGAYSGHRDRPFRLIVTADSGRT